jgi:hypothetical protein
MKRDDIERRRRRHEAKRKRRREREKAQADAMRLAEDRGRRVPPHRSGGMQVGRMSHATAIALAAAAAAAALGGI